LSGKPGLLWFFIFLLSATTSLAQYPTLYYNKGIPQSVLINPSYIPDYKITFSVPLLSSYDLNLRTPFPLKSLNYTTEGDTGYIDLNYLLSKTRNKNIFCMDGNVQLISLGYNTGTTYISLDYSDKFAVDFRYPKDLITLLWNGNEAFIGKTANLNNTALNAIHYNEISLGVAQQVTNEIVAGGRLKYLQGLGSFNTGRSNISLHTDTTTYYLTGTADILLNMSGPYDIDTFYFNDPINYFFTNFHNPGFGIDLGASYRYNKDFTFSASVLDLGYIKWKNQVTNYSLYNQEFTFKGYTIDSNTNFDDFSNIDSMLTELTDSLIDEFDTSKTHNPYRTGIYPKLYISAEYNIDQDNKVGLLYYHRFMGNNYGLNTLSLSYTHAFGKTLAATVNYSLNDFRYSLLGVGFDLKLGSFQLYALCDNVTAIFATSSATSAPINFGINFLVGSKPKVKITQYTPGKRYSRKELKYLENQQQISRKQDTDHDGVPDVIDLCPVDSGSVLAEGCIDSDNDSTGDLFDGCKDTPGPKSNNGCPVVSGRDKELIDLIVNIMEFRTRSDKLKPDVYIYLDELISLMKQDPAMKLRIEGHVYEMPTLKENMELSKARVNNLLKYLTDNGINAARIKATWYGSDRPMFDPNDPGVPVKKNRIEMELYYK
jgi:outer membrane protein OmpA-like peptidoglycan-associated protein